MEALSLTHCNVVSSPCTCLPCQAQSPHAPLTEHLRGRSLQSLPLHQQQPVLSDAGRGLRSASRAGGHRGIEPGAASGWVCIGQQLHWPAQSAGAINDAGRGQEGLQLCSAAGEAAIVGASIGMLSIVHCCCCGPHWPLCIPHWRCGIHCTAGKLKHAPLLWQVHGNRALGGPHPVVLIASAWHWAALAGGLLPVLASHHLHCPLHPGEVEAPEVALGRGEGRGRKSAVRWGLGKGTSALPTACPLLPLSSLTSLGSAAGVFSMSLARGRATSTLQLLEPLWGSLTEPST